MTETRSFFSTARGGGWLQAGVLERAQALACVMLSSFLGRDERHRFLIGTDELRLREVLLHKPVGFASGRPGKKGGVTTPEYHVVTPWG
jgi:hypothetical protein